MTEPEGPEGDPGGLRSDLIAEIVEAYELGATILQLVERHGLTYRRVRGVLLEQAVTLRPARREIPPAPSGLVEAYGREQSIKAVAEQFGLSFGVTRRMLLQAGVKLRSPGGRY